ncbi:hypothetical protein VOLCADRAFT_93770 [Volvox carteri f. nagariensis]|uniref:Uncharacterized protein n=1 Tax=Volvox carteri f. nagariensis TaxID=3068 RepID=D8U305_VOLCA|nr:uncharacterized protein VOLCADRAFT_93770 [Volvox carteri f. nagariensis]EFJ45991.1 hypothetical protein VOLCADRAFT_93770 [Volvox carteri f. nagariensis]|eukprot:XP_002953069.1 hypothetical protein VOLCADRAFT_93770 [Volvox carteri f. nagariensis]
MSHRRQRAAASGAVHLDLHPPDPNVVAVAAEYEDADADADDADADGGGDDDDEEDKLVAVAAADDIVAMPAQVAGSPHAITSKPFSKHISLIFQCSAAVTKPAAPVPPIIQSWSRHVRLHLGDPNGDPNGVASSKKPPTGYY